MTLLLLFLPTGGAPAHTGSAGITLQDVTLTATGAFTIFGTLSVTLDDITTVSVAEVVRKRSIPTFTADLKRQYEREQEMKLSRKLQKDLVETQSVNKELRDINLALAERLNTIADQHRQAREVAQAALETNIQLLQRVSGQSPAPMQVRQPMDTTAHTPQPSIADMRLQQQRLDNLAKAREAKEAKKQAEEEKRKALLKNLAKARKVKAKKNAKK